jgi:hypothetical protein
MEQEIDLTRSAEVNKSRAPTRTTPRAGGTLELSRKRLPNAASAPD